MFSKLLSTALVTDSTWIILLVMLIILFAPMILRPLRIPHILGMILAGVLIGPFGLNVLERDKSFELFGQVGLYYIMFLAALEMDTRSLFRNVKQYLFFGFATFIIPFTLGFFGSRMLLDYNNAQSLLIAGILSSNTLIAYPIISRYGLSKEKSVSLSVGGSMLSLLLSLIIVAAVSDIWNADKKDSAYILWFAGKVAIFFAASIVFIPRMTRVYLRYYSDSVSQFIFVIVMMILSAAMAEVCGIEGILGAFLSGLIMNRYIPKMSPLMNRIEFVGNALFIPYFLIGVGMLINIRSLFNGIGTLQVALFMVIVGTLGKALAAYIGAYGLKLSRNSGNMMFGLTSAHAAGAISILMVGMQMAVGHGKFLMNDEMLDGIHSVFKAEVTDETLRAIKGIDSLIAYKGTDKDRPGIFDGKAKNAYNECRALSFLSNPSFQEIVEAAANILTSKTIEETKAKKANEFERVFRHSFNQADIDKFVIFTHQLKKLGVRPEAYSDWILRGVPLFSKVATLLGERGDVTIKDLVVLSKDAAFAENLHAFVVKTTKEVRYGVSNLEGKKDTDVYHAYKALSVIAEHADYAKRSAMLESIGRYLPMIQDTYSELIGVLTRFGEAFFKNYYTINALKLKPKELEIFIENLNDDEFDDVLAELIQERQERKRRKERYVFRCFILCEDCHR